MKTNTRTTKQTLKLPFLMGSDLEDESFFDDIDKAFQKIQRKNRALPKIKAKPRRKVIKKNLQISSKENVQMQKTFLEISKTHLQPVLRYLKSIQQGFASKDVCDLVQYVIEPLGKKARQVGLEKEAQAIFEFQKELTKVSKGSGKKIDSLQRDRLGETFKKVQKFFQIDFRGHKPAVMNLLNFLKALRKKPAFSDRDIQKFFSIGIPSITMIRRTSVEELASLSGVDLKVLSQMKAQARSHQR